MEIGTAHGIAAVANQYFMNAGRFLRVIQEIQETGGSIVNRSWWWIAARCGAIEGFHFPIPLNKIEFSQLSL